jgi:hypothetical protein
LEDDRQGEQSNMAGMAVRVRPRSRVGRKIEAKQYIPR